MIDETLSLIYKQSLKEKNKKRIEYILHNLIDISLKKIQPYLYSIFGILILIVLINSIQIYYYTKFILHINSTC